MENTKDIVIPILGEGIDQVKIISILIQEGQDIQANENIVEVESEKANLEIPSPLEGTVKKIHAKAGQTMQVGDVLLTLSTSTATETSQADAATTASDPIDTASPSGTEIEAEPEAEPEPEAETTAAGQADVAHETSLADTDGSADPKPGTELHDALLLIPASPSVRRFAREIGIDIRHVPPRQADGRIRLEDVKNHSKMMLRGLEAFPSSQQQGNAIAATSRNLAQAGTEPNLPDFSKWGKIHYEELETIRLKTAQHMSLAHQLIPQVTQYDESDISELENFRRQKNKLLAAKGIKITITAIICKVLTLALQRMPKFNASINMKERKMIFKDYYHIAIAVDTPHGLLVPVVKDVDQKDLQTVAQEINELANLARQKKLGPTQMSGGTITVTNLGGLGTTYFTPIVNWPQVAILGLGRAKQQPRYNEDKERFDDKPRLMMPLSISYDHRAIDGAEAARFLRWISETMEHPLNILLS